MILIYPFYVSLSRILILFGQVQQELAILLNIGSKSAFLNLIC